MRPDVALCLFVLRRNQGNARMTISPDWLCWPDDIRPDDATRAGGENGFAATEPRRIVSDTVLLLAGMQRTGVR